MLVEELVAKRQPLSAITVSVSSGTTTTRDNHGRNPLYGSTGQIGKTDRTEFNGPSILIARVGANAGSVYAVDGAYGVTDNTLVVRLKTGYSVRYVTEFLKHAGLTRMVYGSGQPLVTGTMVKHLEIPIITVDEQAHIAKALHDADDLITTFERLIVKKQSIKQGMMQQLLTGKTRLPGFTDEWRRVQLGEIAKVSRGASPRPIASDRWFDDSSAVGWVRIADLGRSDGLVLKSTTQRLSIDGIARSRFLPAGTLIMSIAATVGVPIVTGIPACIHDGFVAIEQLQGVDQSYLLYTLKSLESELRSAGQTGSQANVNTEIVNGLTINLPSIAEQGSVAEALRSVDEETNALLHRLAKAKAIKQGMMHELLTGRTRLKPVEPGPAQNET